MPGAVAGAAPGAVLGGFEDGRAAAAGRRGRGARREDSRFEAVDGDHIRLVTYLKVEGERKTLEYQVGAVKEQSQWLGRARAADQDVGGGL